MRAFLSLAALLLPALALAADSVLHVQDDSAADASAAKKSGFVRTVADDYLVLRHSALPQYALRLTEPEICDKTVKQYSGYLDVDDDKHFFFWFFESRSKPKTDPLVLWLNGGPGCSSLTGLFMELGPCKPDGMGDVTFNNYSWNTQANVIFLDQPVNVGFSWSEHSKTDNSMAAGEDVYAFLQLFLGEFTKFANSDFHMFGESYAGHYVPAFSHIILEKNKVAEAEGLEHVNLVSAGVGNGLTDPLVQYPEYYTMACHSSYGAFLSDSECAAMKKAIPTCTKMIEACYKWQKPFVCVPAVMYCNKQLIQPFQATGLNLYDVRRKCEGSNGLCYPILSEIEKYLNKPAVKKQLGVDPAVRYQSCNMDVNKNFLFAGDWMKPFGKYVSELLAAADYICNHYGNKAWTTALPWAHHKEFAEAEDLPWHDHDGKHVGDFRAVDKLAFVRVFGAGHMVPYDQPAASLVMLNHWLQPQKENE